MLERTCSYLLLTAIAVTSLTSCAYMTTSGRQQMAYQRYVKKYSGKKMKQQKKFKKVHMPLTPEASEYQTNTELSGSPQSIHSNEAPQQITTEQPPDGN